MASFIEEVPPPIVAQEYDPATLFDWAPRAVMLGEEGQPGELGMPVVNLDKKLMEERFKEHEFNIMASEMISLHRSIPDTRDAK